MAVSAKVFDFDVALTFLDSDKPLALRLEAKLQPNLNVFVYATRQSTGLARQRKQRT
jgi:hypothetical protein